MSELLKVVQDSCQQAIDAVKDLSARAPGTILTQALAVGALTGFLAYQLTKKRYRLPPGPWALPLLGNIPLLQNKEQFYIVLDRLAREKYGPVMTVYLGPILCVMLNDVDSMTEALVQKGADYAGRPHLFSVHTMAEGSNDIAFADYSPSWKLRRKIALKAIRQYMTGPHLEKVVHEVMAQVGDRMLAEQGPFDPHQYTSTLMFHIINCISFGEIKPYDDQFIQELIEDFDAVNREIGNGFFEDIIPLLKYWPTKKFRKIIARMQKFWDYLEENIQSHRQSFQPDNVRDMTDSILLAQMEVAREESAEDMAMFTNVHVRQTISDLFGAGVDTSRFTLDWAVLYLAGYPEVQKRAQAEIDAVTGSELPGVEHRSQLQYTQAVLQEVMRTNAVLPLSVPHQTVCDTTVGGYEVPKDTMVMINLWAVTHDPKVWEDPHTFNPDRFLDEQGKLKPTPKAWAPFSAGRRMCLGETVARPELLLLVACLLKRFDISLPEGVTFDPAYEKESMMIHSSKPYKIVVSQR